MRYLQDVARICADDYNCISQGAMQYSEVLMLQRLSGPLFNVCSQVLKYRSQNVFFRISSGAVWSASRRFLSSTKSMR